MIRSLLSYLLITAVIMQSFSKWLIFTEFKVNQNYISKNLCINKSSPSKHCNGHCHLVKQLQKDAEQNNDQSSASKSKVENILFKNDFIEFIKIYRNELSYSYMNAKMLYPAEIISSVFHPPC